MSFSTLDSVVLERDLPAHGLKRGDLGVVVHVHEDGSLEVEFVIASGRTGALLTVASEDVRAVADNDIVSVRTFHRVA